MARAVYSVDAAMAAKHLGVGRNTLLNLLRENGYTHAHAPRRNLPKQQYREAGLFTTELVQFYQGPVRKLHEKLKITAAGMELCRQLIEESENYVV